MKPATQKIWCPECHKRHKVPPNAGGMTLRCRGCQFAFRTQDGLTVEPATSPVVPVAVPDSGSSSEPVSKVGPTTEVSAVNSSPTELPAETPIPRLDHNYDDILDVLENPSEQPVRAYAKSETVSETALATSRDGVDESRKQDEVRAVVRAPVTKRKLQAHRQSRKFWMLIALSFASLVGVFSWLGVSLFVDSELSNWERKLMYSFGVPARFLPPLEQDNEELEPANSIKLKGEHADLANRNDNFRDEFVVRRNEQVPPDNRVDGANDPGQPPAGRRVAANDIGDGNGRLRMNGPVMSGENRDGPGVKVGPQADPSQPAARQRMAQQAMNNNGQLAGNRNAARKQNRGIDRNRNRPAWKPPAITSADVQLVSIRGMDPRVVGSLQLEQQVDHQFAVSGDVLFTVDRRRRLNAIDWKTKTQLASRQLEHDVVSLVKSSSKRETRGVWLLSSNGRVEKWDVSKDGLERGASLPIGEVDTQNRMAFAMSEYQIALRSGSEIIIADYLPTEEKIASTVSIPIPEYVNSNSQGVLEPIHAMQFSQDGEQLLAVINDKVCCFDTRNGKQLSHKKLPKHCVLPRDSKDGSCVISEDLRQIMFCKSGFIKACDFETGNSTGQYWAASPLPIRFVGFGSGLLVGVSDNGKPIATVFQPNTGVFSRKPDAGENKDRADAAKDRDVPPDSKPEAKAGLPDPNSDVPFLVSTSPTLSGPIQSLHFLNDSSLVFLSSKRQVSIADWKNGWRIKSLSIATEKPVERIAVAPDDSTIATVTSTGIQIWRITDRDSGKVEAVSSFSKHAHPVSSIIFSNDSTHVISGDKQGNVLAWSTEQGKQTGGIEGFNRPIVSIVPKGESGFVAMDSLAFGKGDVEHIRDRVIEFGRTVPANSRFSKNGNRIAFPSGNRLQIADRNSQRIVKELDVSETFRELQFSHDHNLVLLLSRSGISVWDWSRGTLRGRLSPLGSSDSNAFDLSDDDKYIAVVDNSQKPKISIFSVPSRSNSKK